MVICVAVGSAELQLYDVREVLKGPFKSQSISDIAGQALVAGVRFIPPLGDHILLAMTDGSCHLFDSFSLQHCATLRDADLPSDVNGAGFAAINGIGGGGFALSKMQDSHLGQNVTVTPDGKTVVVGGRNGSISFWDISRYTSAEANASSASTLQPSVLAPDGVWNGSHDGPVGVCAFNPQIMECITGAQTLAIWTSSVVY
ncbi:hypothetical protein GGI24_001496 [Coemansia furcata]|nr:hypothetical protein GGI24_001496 [Coemansia furcata]